MNMKIVSPVFAAILLVLPACFAAGGTKGEESGLSEVRAFVSILPQSYFVERIGGMRVSVEVLVEPGKSPHTFELTPRQMTALVEADLYFGIGFVFEERILKKIQNANHRFELVRTDRGIERRPLEGLSRNHGNEEELDPHIWLSVPEIRIQSSNIYEALVKRDPEYKDVYKRNFEDFMKDLDGIHERLSMTFEPYRGLPFFVFHPSFGYFADLYGLRQVPIEIEGKGPTPKQLESLIEEAKKKDVKIIFVSPQFDKKGAETVAGAIGGTVVAIDPLAKNVLENLENIAAEIEKSLAQYTEQ
jgi:zinc transport system substrate-binding protein